MSWIRWIFLFKMGKIQALAGQIVIRYAVTSPELNGFLLTKNSLFKIDYFALMSRWIVNSWVEVLKSFNKF